MNLATLLLEGQNYREMFSHFKPVNDPALDAVINEAIRIGRTILVNKDRVQWYLKFIRSAICQGVEDFLQSPNRDEVLPEGWINVSFYKDFQIPSGHSRFYGGGANTNYFFTQGVVFNVTNKLKHYMGVAQSCQEMQQLRFGNKPVEQLLNEMQRIEQNWQSRKDAEKQFVEPNGEPIIDCGNGWAWYDLQSAYCDDEAAAMGHCGNRYGHDRDNVLSLRQNIKGRHRPSLTFIIRDGFLGEMKGRANEKPNPKYHPMIVQLLKADFVKGIEPNAGYEPHNNFEMSDLPENVREELFKMKPGLMTYAEEFKRNGMTEELRQRILPKLREQFSNIVYDERNKGFVLGQYDAYLEAVLYWFGNNRSFARAINIADSDHDFDGGDEYWRWLEHDLPQAYIDKIMEVIATEHREEFLDEFDESDLNDEGPCLKFFAENLDDGSTGIGYSSGCEAAYHKSAMEIIKSAVEGTSLNIIQGDQKWLVIISDSNAVKLASLPEDEFADATNSFGEEVDKLNDPQQEGFDREAALNSFRDFCDSDFLPEVPTMRDVNYMDFAQCCDELGKSEEDVMVDHSRYASSGATPLAYIRNSVLRHRKREWGVEKNDDEPVVESIIMEGKMHDYISVRQGARDADFWIVRMGPSDEVGRPMWTWNPSYLAVKVMKNGVSIDHLFYYFQSLFLMSRMEDRAHELGDGQYYLRANDLRDIDIDT